MTTLVIIVLTVLLLAAIGTCIYLVVQLNQLSDDHSDVEPSEHVVDELSEAINSYFLQVLRLRAQLLELQTSHDSLWQVHLSTVDKLLEMQERYEPDSLPRLLSMPWIEEHVPYLEISSTSDV